MAKKEQFTTFIRPELAKDIDLNMKSSGCKSKSQYIENALEFYNGYLHAKNNEDYVSKVIVSTIQGIMDDFADRIAKLMFKQAVEMAKVYQIIVTGFDVPKYRADEIHLQCMDEVKQINGSIHYPTYRTVKNDGKDHT